MINKFPEKQIQLKQKFTAILLAAGAGQRFINASTKEDDEDDIGKFTLNSESIYQVLPKQFWNISENYSVIEKSCEAILPFCHKIVLTLPNPFEQEEQITIIIERLKQMTQMHNCQMILCKGGNTRQESVSNALKFIDSEYLFIHDGARPLVHKQDLGSLLESVITNKAAILANRVTDTIKISNCSWKDSLNPSSRSLKAISESPFQGLGLKNSEREPFLISNTLSRENLWAAQTPQAFDANLFKQAMKQAKDSNYMGTDDASLMEYSGFPVALIETLKPNPKITYQHDLDYVKFLLNNSD